MMIRVGQGGRNKVSDAMNQRAFVCFELAPDGKAGWELFFWDRSAARPPGSARLKSIGGD